MTNDHEPDVLRSHFESARRHDESVAPDLDDLLIRPARRSSSWMAHPRLLMGSVGLVGSAALATAMFVYLPLLRETPLPADPPVMSGQYLAIQLQGHSSTADAAGTLDSPSTLSDGAKRPALPPPPSQPPPAELAHGSNSLGEIGGVAGGGGPSHQEVVNDLPIAARLYQNAMNLAPGVQDADGEGNPNVHGVRDRDFKATVNGVASQDPLAGQWLSKVCTDCIEEIEVVTAGASAIYGGAQGGSVRVVQAQLTKAPLEIAPESNTERYGILKENEFLAVADNPLSTFSIDVDTASYSVVRRFLKQGQLPPADAVRIEELINYFPYSYPQPTGSDPFSVNVEIASCPWAKTHRLARIGLHGREVRREATSANLVFLIDVSGSMESPEKLPLLKSALLLLVDQLGASDQVAIVVYAGVSGLVLPSTSGSRTSDIRAAIEMLGAAGGTNGGEGLKLAYRVAREHLVQGGVNRVILATDGDFNVGVTDRGELLRLVEENAKAGVALTTLGFGMGNYNDEMLETLADHGNGNHFYIDDEREARKVLVEQVGGTLVTIAKDVKIQVEFNPDKVGAYRLLGYENRMLAKEDFNDDRKDAGEIGSGHDVTALYELIPPGEALDRPQVDALKYQVPAAIATENDETLTVKLRYKDPDGDTSRLFSVSAKDSGVNLAAASDDTRFAAAVAAFGMVLRDSSHRGAADLDLVTRLAADTRGADVTGYRSELRELVERARGLLPR